MDLPSLVLINIFDYFNVNEKIKLKFVCKQWNKELDSLIKRSESLFVYLNYYPSNITWSYANKLVQYKYSVKVSKIKDLTETFNVFKNIKNLYFYKYYDDDVFNKIWLQNLKRFAKIEQLEIYKCKMQDEQPKLDLPNIKILSIKKTLINNRLLYLKLPALENLIFWMNTKLIKLSKPENLKYIEVLDFDLCLTEFKNLEYIICQFLECKNFNSESPICYEKETIRTLLEKFTKLKELHFIIEYEDALTDKINESDLKLYKSSFDNSPYCCWRGFNYPCKEHKIENVKTEYDSLPKNIPWMFDINYTRLIDTFQVVPKDFLKKFINIKMVKIEKVADQDQLIDFFKGLKMLRKIKLDCAQVRPDFYNHLWLVDSVRHLELKNKAKWNLVEFDWLEKLKNLNSIKVKAENVPVKFILTAYEKCREFETFGFKSTKTFTDILIKRRFKFYNVVIESGRYAIPDFDDQTEKLASLIRNQKELSEYIV